MSGFYLSDGDLDLAALRSTLLDARAGAYAQFEGRVRDHNDGKAVLGLRYDAYRELALREGALVIQEAEAKFTLLGVACVHRLGELRIGDLAVWVGVSAAHRGAAFDACRFVIDEVKARVPIWKHEIYAELPAAWLHPES